MKPSPHPPQRRALDHQVARTNLFGAGAALAVASLLLLLFQFMALRSTLLEDLQVQARIIGDNSSAALLFSDQRAGNEILAGLALSPAVLGAALVAPNGHTLSLFERRPGSPSLQQPISQEWKQLAGQGVVAAPRYRYSLLHLDVLEPVNANGGAIGTVLLRATLLPLYQRLASFAAFTLAVAIGSFALAWLMVARMRRAVRRAEDHLHFLAHVDPITALPNRNAFNARLATALAREPQVGLLLLDLDNFKVVNDTLGHNCGDDLLLMVAQRLLATLGSGDVVCRIGGDEFVVIVPPGQDDPRLDRIAAKVLTALAEPFQLEHHLLYVSASIGMSLFPDHAPDAEALIRCADTAMYYAKSQGKNGYECFVPAMEQRALKRMQLEANLRLALENDELSLHYQPQIDVLSGRMTGMEVLTRWTSATLGHVSPAEFIPVAEESGVIVPLGHWVLQTTCRQAALWRAAGLLDGIERIAVNLSACQTRDCDLMSDLEAILAETGLPPSLLELEITEGVLMDNVQANLKLMECIRAAGIQLSIDDFGTGYSSMAYLKRFPIDQLKIDRSFVKDVPGEGTPIATAIIAMAHSLNLSVVAEGVETIEQVEFLRKAGCDLMQGYYFARPMPPEQLESLLREQRQFLAAQPA
ncbi:EAL domain-containing protein [Oxalobacteraceae bacterium]|nr:EAL domain-containing protein [Oxalobacteraceae bacterium]